MMIERRPLPCLRVALAALGLLLAVPAAADDLNCLGDEFDGPQSLARWQRVHLVEEWNADQLETWSVGGGRMTMMPFTCTWFQNYRGPLAFQTVGGDFVVTTSVHATGRDGVSVPQSVYSLAGLMIRTPRAITPATWTPGGENFVFLSLGYGSANPRRFQFEVKTTQASVSMLELSDAPESAAELQLARIGGSVIALRREPGGDWTVHRRYPRADFPESLQVGMVAYTDWGKVQHFDPFVHNGTVLDPPLPPGVVDPNPAIPYWPDLLADFDYVHVARPQVPAPLVGLPLHDPLAVSDAELLAFLGQNADMPCPLAGVPGGAPGAGLELTAFPNPWFGAVEIAFAALPGAPARLSVFDLQGRRVATLIDEASAAGGRRAVRWQGRPGERSGVYLVRLQSGERTVSKVVVRMR
jgi:hypothetical protein